MASRISAIPEVVSDGAEAFLVELGDVEALADRLAKLLSDPGLRATMGRMARERVATAFNLDRFCAGLQQTWLEVLGTQILHPAPTPQASQL